MSFRKPPDKFALIQCTDCTGSWGIVHQIYFIWLPRSMPIFSGHYSKLGWIATNRKYHCLKPSAYACSSFLLFPSPIAMVTNLLFTFKHFQIVGRRELAGEIFCMELRSTLKRSKVADCHTSIEDGFANPRASQKRKPYESAFVDKVKPRFCFSEAP